MAPFLKEVAESLYQKFGLNIQHCAIVFNNKRPAVYLQKYLSEVISKPFFSPSFFTIQDFFRQAIDEKIADPYLQFFTLHRLYNELLLAEGLPAIKSSQFYPLAKIILSDFEQIDSDLVDATLLYKELENISIINRDFNFLTPEQYEFLSNFWASYSEGKHRKKQELFIQMWRRMPKLYHLFHQSLQSEKCITHGGSYRKLSEMETLQIDFLQPFEKIIFVGFNALSRAEAALFKKLQSAEKALFYFDNDAYYMNDPLQEAGLFLRKNIQQLQLKNEFEKPFQYIKNQPRQVDVYKVQGQSAQAKILNQLLKTNYEKKSDNSTTAIVLADESLLIPALQTIPTIVGDEEIGVNITMGFPFTPSSVFGLIHLWLNGQTEMATHKPTGKQTPSSTVPYHLIECFLSHPLINIKTTTKEEIRKEILKKSGTHIAQNTLQEKGGIFSKFFIKASNPKALIDALADLLQYIRTDLSSSKALKEIDSRLLEVSIQELNKLNDNIGEYIEREENHFIISLIQKVLRGLNVPFDGSPLNGIQLMGLLETRNLNFDKIIFLGFNEGIVPKTDIGNSFIPDSLRRAYGLPVLENLDAVSAYMVYRLVQRAKQIHIVYNCLSNEKYSGEPSRFLKQLEYESNFQFSYYEPELEIKAEQKKEIVIDKKIPAIQQVLQQYLNGNKPLSPSAITTYIAHPTEFYFKYIAQIPEPKAVTTNIEANEIGSILHDAMQSFYTCMIGKMVYKEWIQLNRYSTEQMIKNAWGKVRNITHIDNYKFSGMEQVVLSIVNAYMSIILDEDENYAPFKIIGLEKEMITTLPFAPNSPFSNVKIKGLIDRIDEKGGVTRIVDYKTGADQLKISEDIKKIFSTDGKYINKAFIQTMIYTAIYETTHDKTDVLPALYAIRNMKDEGVYFKFNKDAFLKDQLLTDTKQLFIEELEATFQELFDESIPFRNSRNPDNYIYSIFKTLSGL